MSKMGDFYCKGCAGELTPLMQYVFNIGTILSQSWSAVLGGDPDETVSSRVGKAERAGKWWAKHIASPILDFMFQEKNHAINAIEDNEGKRQIWDWSK